MSLATRLSYLRFGSFGDSTERTAFGSVANDNRTTAVRKYGCKSRRRLETKCMSARSRCPAAVGRKELDRWTSRRPGLRETRTGLGADGKKNPKKKNTRKPIAKKDGDDGDPVTTGRAVVVDAPSWRTTVSACLAEEGRVGFEKNGLARAGGRTVGWNGMGAWADRCDSVLCARFDDWRSRRRWRQRRPEEHTNAPVTGTTRTCWLAQRPRRYISFRFVSFIFFSNRYSLHWAGAFLGRWRLFLGGLRSRGDMNVCLCLMLKQAYYNVIALLPIYFKFVSIFPEFLFTFLFRLCFHGQIVN